MKKVISEEKRSEVYLSDLTSLSIVGLENGSGDRFALCSTDVGYEFIGLNTIYSTRRLKYSSLKEALVNRENLFVFETTKELFKWMSE
jgi:hypothetical protein